MNSPLRATLALLLLLLVPTTTPAQDLPKARALLAEALLALQPELALPIATPEALDLAIAAAAAAGVPDAVLTLSPALVYPRRLTLTAPITLQSTGMAGPQTRMDATTPLPSFLDGLTISGEAQHVRVIGVDVRSRRPTDEIVTLLGTHLVLDRVRVLGDPVTGAKRCIGANANGDVVIDNSYIAQCFAPSPGADSQAIAAWNMGPGLVVRRTLLSGGSETVLLGGADAPEDRTPADVLFEDNTITKDPAWFLLPIGVKNLVEIKNAKRVVFRRNAGSYAWVNGQTGYLVVLSVRNQDGRAPWATIQDVLFEHNTWSEGGGAINLLGRDDIKETGAGKDVPVGTVRRSVPMARVTFQDETYRVDPVKYAKTTNMKLIMIGGGPHDLTLNRVAFSTLSTLGSAVYFASGPTATNFTFTNVTLPTSAFGMFSVVGGSSKYTATNLAWTTYVSGGTIAEITVTP